MPARQDDDAWRPYDTDRSIDPFDPSYRPPSRGPQREAQRSARAPQRSTPPRDAGGSGLNLRIVLLVGGSVLAVGATLLVFLTDDADLLRVAVVAAAWAFVLATFATGRRRGDQAAAEAREESLRRSYEAELDREVAARREYELELENELRREAEQSMREELDALRGDLAAVTELRDEVARVSALRDDVAALTGLRDDVAALTGLRDEVARVAALGDDVAALTSLRAELGQVGELRSELDRLRAELTEQLSSEMLVERIVMRTQAGRLSGSDLGRLDTAATRLDTATGRFDAAGTWREEPPRELTGGWPATRLDEPPVTQLYPAQQPVTQHYPAAQHHAASPHDPVTQHYAAEPAETRQHRVAAEPVAPPPAAPRPLVQEPATSRPAVSTPRNSTPPKPYLPPEPPAASRPAPPAPAAPETAAYGMSLPPRRSRHSADADAEWLPPAPTPTPLEWLGERSLLDAPAEPPARMDFAAPPVAGATAQPAPNPRRRRTDDERDAGPDPRYGSPDEERTTERPAAPRRTSAGYPFGAPVVPEEPASADEPGHHRLEQILAESGVTPATGSRRRRRYRDDDEADDDVLARVLRGR
jgi:hypothetical protein